MATTEVYAYALSLHLGCSAEASRAPADRTKKFYKVPFHWHMEKFNSAKVLLQTWPGRPPVPKLSQPLATHQAMPSRPAASPLEGRVSQCVLILCTMPQRSRSGNTRTNIWDSSRLRVPQAGRGLMVPRLGDTHHPCQSQHKSPGSG